MSWKILKPATKWINKNLDFSDLLKSRLVLYFFFFLSIVNLYTLAISGNGLYAAIFILSSFLTTFFSKNMIIVLCLGLVVSNILRQGIEIRVVQDNMPTKEGMTTEEGVTESMKEGIAELEEENESDDESDPKPADENRLNSAKLEYKKLLELQNKLIDGVSTMSPLLKEAKDTFKKLKELV
jgi:hypothetical protein